MKPRWWWLNPWRYVLREDARRAEQHAKAMQVLHNIATEMQYPESMRVYRPEAQSVLDAQVRMCDWCRRKFVCVLVARRIECEAASEAALKGNERG